MEQKEKELFYMMVSAIEEKNEKELQYLIAKQEADKLQEAFRAYCSDKPKPRTEAKEIRLYAGIEDYVEFFKRTLEFLGLEDIVNYEIEEVDGELEIVVKEEI